MLVCIAWTQTLCDRRSFWTNCSIKSRWNYYTKLYSDLMFRVVAGGFSQEFERWIDAVHTANSLKPNCKSWFVDIRIFDEENLVWVYSLSHTYPQYIGSGTYKRLALLFLQEAAEEKEWIADYSSDNYKTHLIFLESKDRIRKKWLISIVLG